MSLPEVFHLYFSGFLGMVVLLWIWELRESSLRKRKKESRGKCPICKTEWQSEANLYQKRCEKCGVRLKLRQITEIR